MTDANLRALRAASNTAAFVAACRAMVGGSPYVAYEPAALDELVSVVQAAKPVSWDWYLRDPAGPLDGRWYDIVVSSALNGGYFEADARGAVRQWAVNGSGSEALLAWIGGLRDGRLLPGVDRAPKGASAASAYRDELAGALAGTAYPAERLDIMLEIADIERLARAMEVLDDLRADDDGRLTGALGLRHVDHLAACLPTGFGDDPFRKKACLAVLLLTSHLVAHGHRVSADIPIPSDYQLPRIFAYKGAIAAADELVRALIAGDLLDPACEMVTHFRAAAVVAAHDLGRLAGVPDWAVDGALFGGVRKDPDFKAYALPPMKIRGLWF